MKNKHGSCGECPFRAQERVCKTPGGKAPEQCSTKLYPEVIEQAVQTMQNDPDVLRFAKNAALQEAACYAPSPYKNGKRMPLKPRIMETIEFAQRMGYRKLGLAFCIGLDTEAKKLTAILMSHGFEVVSVCCKVGGCDKSLMGVNEDEKINRGGHESMCNPVAQAMILNAEKTELNLLLGLCVGHDSLMIRYSEAPVTVVAVKDRLMGHNPIAALYSGYYCYLLK